jgi:hypothetical protein
MRRIRTPNRPLTLLAPLCVMLSCAPLPRFVLPPATTQPGPILRCDGNFRTGGSAAATIELPRHSLSIPAGSLPPGARVRVRALGGDSTGVQITVEPAGTVFDPPAILRLRTDHCTPDELANPNLAIWRFPADGAPEPIESARDDRARTFIGRVTRTSSFMIAN